MARLHQALDAGRGARVELLHRAKDGREYWVDLDVRPLVDDAGRPSGFVGVETDITERVEERAKMVALLAALPVGVAGRVPDDAGAMVLAVIFICIVLASPFGSFVQPVAVMASLPLALIGVMVALLQAEQIRMRPIAMTTAAMIFGMLPLALALNDGGELQAPMGRAIVGGLITSTLLTLVVVPVLYSYLVREHVALGGAVVLRAALADRD